LKPGVAERVRFLRAFLRRPAAVGAIGPSSRTLANAMLAGCKLSTSETVVELGPGTGAFTGPILENIGRSTTFFALEIDPGLSRGLRKRFPGLTVYNDSAEKIDEYLARHGKTQANYIISGLPWASLPLKVQDNILRVVLASLAPGGLFVTFGYLHARWMPNAQRFRRRLEERFSRVTTSEPVWANFPPAFIYRCER
jgi:phospholipid N-methyltransferase